MAEHGKLADVPKRSKRAQNDPRWSLIMPSTNVPNLTNPTFAHKAIRFRISFFWRDFFLAWTGSTYLGKIGYILLSKKLPWDANINIIVHTFWNIHCRNKKWYFPSKYEQCSGRSPIPDSFAASCCNPVIVETLFSSNSALLFSNSLRFIRTFYRRYQTADLQCLDDMNIKIANCKTTDNIFFHKVQ